VESAEVHSETPVQKRVAPKEFHNLLTVAAFEFRRNFFSVKMVVAAGFFLFVMLASTYGLTETNEIMMLRLKLDEPNEILSTTSPILAYVMALIVVIFGSNSITEELNSRTVDILVCKPMKPSTIITGKFLGITSALGVPVTIAIPLMILIIRDRMGYSPDALGILGFWFFSLMFMATFVLFSLLFATMSRSGGEAIISGIMLFLIYTFIWPLITLLVQAVAGVEVNLFREGSENSLTAIDTVGLANPVMNYQNAIAYVFSTKNIHGIPPWLPLVCLVAWMIGLLFLSRRLFTKRIREQDY
jgi:ABC-type transport system involved in multi-copper enzyme maturation permease subunit